MAMRLDHGADDLTEVHDINVTPFIDVMLVLLIIFMVAAPLATVDIAVNLPSSNAQPQQRPSKPVYLTLKADLSLALGDNPVARERLDRRARRRYQRRQGGADLPARRPQCSLRRRHAGDERAARGPLSEGRAGRVGNAGGAMTAISLGWFEEEEPRDFVRWGTAAAIVLGVHAAAIAFYLVSHQPEEIGDDASAVTIELAPIENTPDAVERDVTPAPETMIE